MPRKFYPAEYREHLVALVRQGRTAESLAREFEPTAQTIRNWVKAANAADAGDAPIDKDARIAELERANAVLREEGEILKNVHRATARPSEKKLVIQGMLGLFKRLAEQLTGAHSPVKNVVRGPFADPHLVTPWRSRLGN